ncbi:trehalose-6-phosphate synthase [Uliginosibacterium sp. 31-16]|uniref:alpha,alpha-trehalose-phosphate synthase (UDP-forming) n=1 Tax=Uliginosibacterium sp. 31-16 TaxID=3068315 RepID=UPI00273D601C|nr:trehalose-6-phosphate synthase [Uliginosibacterium sp. 31-16]MDP5241188.1 trehalose-6-phosphate synthase [Uliginosibacterium sp. 31-16]
MKLFRFQLRFLLPVVITLTVASLLAFPAMEALTQRWFSRDLNLRGSLLASAMSESINKAVSAEHADRLRPLFERTLKDERLAALGLCGPDGTLLLTTPEYPVELSCSQANALAGVTPPRLVTETGSFHVATHQIPLDSGLNAEIILLHDLSFIERRTLLSRQYFVIFVVSLGLIIALTVVVSAQLSWNTWMKGIRGVLLRQDVVRTPKTPAPPEIPADFAADIRAQLRDLEDEYRRKQGGDEYWTAARLRSLLRTQLRGDQVIVVSNREPCIHDWVDGNIVAHSPASGLVTAIEPVMRACSGTWIAHGSGSADAVTADGYGRLALPPDSPEYTLRRLWLSKEEEAGYYDGFSNSGLWPLCHLAHTQPVFRETDWQLYRSVNQRFADAVIAETRIDDPVILVQDYHLALVPAMVRKHLPRATVISFWHIPWPAPETFEICPWHAEILQGLLGSTILGFQTRQHSQSFIQTVDRLLEARIDHEHSVVWFHDEGTLIESYPISISWPAMEAHEPSIQHTGIRQQYAPNNSKIIIGIDRLDYIKGIPERLAALEHLLERHPEWIGKLVLLQVAAPSRENMPDYQAFKSRLELQVQRINTRFGKPGYQPVHLLARYHSHAEIQALYRAADICMVSSLHDGMNLVCKEFIAARDDEHGVLLLSQFAGASRELPEALSINPYHVENMSGSILKALLMPEAEQRERMASMRMTVREANVFRWAGRMLTDASRQRLRRRVEQRVRRYHKA